MQITIFGASGKVGRLVVQDALDRGYKVVAVVHTNDPFAKVENLQVVKADVYSSKNVAKAIKDSKVVVSCLGSWGRKTASGNRNVLSSAMQAIIPSMQEQKISRILTLTGSGAADPLKNPGLVHRLIMTTLAPFPAGKVFRDGEQHMQLLVASPLDWTAIRSPIMNNRGGLGYKLSLHMGIHFVTISRRAVAACLVDQLESDKWLRQAPIISQSKL